MSRIEPKKITSYPWYLRILLHRQQKKYGCAFEPTLLWARVPRAFLGFLWMNSSLQRKKSPLDPTLRALITVKVSQINACSFCIDMNSALFFQRGGENKKLEDLPNFEKSSLFSEREKVALKFAKTVTQSSQKVPEELFTSLKKHFNEDEIVELTALISFQNLSSKFNATLGANAYGFCKK